MKTKSIVSCTGLFLCTSVLLCINASVHSATQQGVLSLPAREHPAGGILSTEDASRLYDFQRASIKGDRSHLTKMLQSLDNPSHEGYEYGLPHMLARLGSTEALPILETYILHGSESTLSNVAKAAKCRIIAEDAVKKMPDGQAKSLKKLQIFLNELRMSATDLNSSLLAYQQPEVNSEGRTVIRTGAKLKTLGITATDEIADMIYHGSYQDYASLPGVAQINFQADYPAALKMRLAPLTREQRIGTMINDLANKTVMRGEDNYEIQLLVDEGTAASEAAAAKLRQMDANKTSFSGAGFGLLINVIAGVGDMQQIPLLDHFEGDADGTTANCAYLAGMTLKQGSKRFTVWGY